MEEYDISYTQNRELSWLMFNRRVLEEACDEAVPLYERLKFVSIFKSNLDEFFMIRVGGMLDLSFFKNVGRDDKTNMTVKEQLSAVFTNVAPLYKMADKAYQSIEQSMRLRDVYCLEMQELAKSEKKLIEDYFKGFVLPVLSPQIIDSSHPFPHIENKTLSIVAMLKNNNKNVFAIVNIPNWLPHYVMLPGANVRYVMMEKIVLHYIQTLFRAYDVADKAIISVTRNADITLGDEVVDSGEDSKQRMKKVLKKRSRLAPVRLEIDGNKTDEIVKYLCGRLFIQKNQVFKSDSPINMKYVYSLHDKFFPTTRKTIEYEDYTPAVPPGISSKEKMIKQIQKGDILLYYPYDSFEPFLRLLRECAHNTDVISIKITIYRLDKISNLAESLIIAAGNNIDVTVLMELRARFDEQNNIDWAESLMEAGCKVIYGIEGYKVHSKICLITYRDKTAIRHITQIGTGNYNEKTAKLYTDLCLMTADERISHDAIRFFNNMAISDLGSDYDVLMVAPEGLEPGLIRLIDEEIAKGDKGSIIIKANSIAHRPIIDKLAQASQAGVSVQLIIRGICCILPGVKDKTENMEIHCIVGRFLEHTRVYIFSDKIYIGSADFMTRNLAHRVEIACPIFDPRIKQQIMDDIHLAISDNVKGRVLQSNGQYVRLPITGEMIDSQMEFMKSRKLVLVKAVASQEQYKEESLSKKLKGFVKRFFDNF